MATFADRLRRLVEDARRANGGDLSYARIAERIEAAGGPSTSGQYIQQLVSGKRANPGINYVQAFARYFGVPMDYFVDDAVAARVDAQLEQLHQERQRLDQLRAADQRVSHIATRAGELSDAGLKQIAELVELVRRAEQADGQEVKPEHGRAG